MALKLTSKILLKSGIKTYTSEILFKSGINPYTSEILLKSGIKPYTSEILLKSGIKTCKRQEVDDKILSIKVQMYIIYNFSMNFHQVIPEKDAIDSKK